VRIAALLVSVLGLVAVGAAGGSALGPEHDTTARLTPPKVLTATRHYVFPVRASKNHRYLVDGRGVPFMIVGDSPQALIGNLNVKAAAAYIANRRAAGFDALWVNLLCTKYTGCRSDGSTFDGIAPFTREGDLSTPNPSYFERAAAILRLAQRAGMAVFLDPIETGGWLDVLRSNGAARDAAYGRFVGRRFRGFRNIVWLSGNDFQTWKDRADDAVVRAVALGIHSADPGALQTVELNYLRSSSRDDARWRGIIKLDAAYTYFATYAKVLQEFERRPALPVFLLEAGYEFEQNLSSISPGNPQTLRRQEYWTALSGATGQFYGNHYTWQFADGWTHNLDTEGSAQLGYLVNLFARRPWFRLVPDLGHRFVTKGYGTFAPNRNVASSDYVTAAATPDGRLAIAYLPEGGTIRVDTRRMAGRVHASWYDPTSGRYTAVEGSPFAARRSLDLTAPDQNRDGDRDWVLVLTAA
jgi:uncharacterized protein DUF4038/collagenase-like protein with putative collagen-binding domain